MTSTINTPVCKIRHIGLRVKRSVRLIIGLKVVVQIFSGEFTRTAKITKDDIARITLTVCQCAAE